MRDNESAPKPSRRAFVAAAIGATVAVVPAAAIAATAQHPDRELIELGRQYVQLWSIEEKAYAEFNRCSELYTSQEPDPRDVLRHTIEDQAILGLPILDTCRSGLSSDIHENDFYSEAEVERLPTTERARPWNVVMQQIRISEITAEWDRWQEECAALDEATGYSDAEEAAEAVTEAMSEIEEKVISIVAKTVAGLQVRAVVMKRIFSHNTDEEYTDARLVQAMIRDLDAMQAPTV